MPALGALIVEPLYNLADSAIVGHLGRAPLAALALATAGLNILGWISGFLEMVTVSAVSFRRAAGDEAGAGRAVGAAYLLSGALGLVLGGIVALVAPLLVAVLGGYGHGVVSRDAVLYLRIAAVGLPVLLVGLAGNGHLTGLADTRRPLLVALVANVANVGLELAFVYGLHLGIAGSAWGTVIAQAIAAGMFIALSRRAPVPPAMPRQAELAELVRSGLPLTTRTIALGSALLATTAIAARLGTAALAGHQVALQVWTLLALSLDALAVPAQVYVSEALGAADRAAARSIGRRTLLLGLATGTVLGLLTAALSGILPAAFSPDASVRHEAVLALLVCAAQQPLAAAAFVLDGLVLGAADYAALRRVMLLALVAFAPMAIVTLAVSSVGIVGIWLAMLCWLGARAGLLGRYWWRFSEQPGLRGVGA